MYLLVTGFYAFLSHLDYLYAAVAAYLCGCFNGALFTSRLFFHDDVRTHGSGNAGMPNILRNPRTWIPPTLAAAITGPMATCLFHLEMNGPAVSSGMGTCGLVGQIGVYTGWIESGKAVTAFDWIGLVLICFVLPAVLSTIFCEVLRKKGWIKEGDLKL